MGFLFKPTFKSNALRGGNTEGMDSEELEQLAAQTRLGQQAKRLAYAVLVNDLSAAKAAEQEGVSRQLAAQAAKRVLQQRQLVEHYPEDWVTVTATLPKQWAQLVKYIQTLEKAKAGLITKANLKVPEFELSDIAEFSKLVEEILKKWRKIA